jgi:type I restriction enzyme S subunit
MAGEWKHQEIGKAFDVNPSRTIKRGQITPFIPMDALPENGRSAVRIDEREFTGSGIKFQNGDTLIARITPCLENGKTAFISGLADGVVAHGSTEYIVLAGKPGETDDLFAYYLARSPDFRQYAIGHMEGTSGRQRVPSVAVENYIVTLPPLPEQRAIAHILGTLDDKIELNHRMNKTLEAIARAIFKSWFVDFDPVRAKASGESPESICSRLGLSPELLSLFPGCLVDSELGEIPEGWVVRGLDGIALLSTTGTSPGKRPLEIFEHYSIPAFDAGSMPVYDLGGTIKSNKYTVSPNAVLVSKLNPETPRVWLPTVKTDRAVCSTEFMQFVPTRNCGRSYLYLLMCSDPMQVEILRRVTGSTGSRQRAQPSQIATLPIVVPAEEVIRAFESLVSPLLTDAGRNLAQSETLALLRDALLPQLLSGELRVPVVAKIT